MKKWIKLAVWSAAPVLLFLLLAPLWSSLGEPRRPEVRHRSSRVITESWSGLNELANPEPVENLAAKPALGPWRALEGAEQAILALTNEERRKNGLSNLEPEPDLTTIARKHGLDMAEKGFFDHINPRGQSPVDRMWEQHRTLIGTGGENLWSTQGQAVSDDQALAAIIVDGWLESPGHRDNILRPELTHLGVGVVAVGDSVWATQHFATVAAYLDTPCPKSVSSGSKLDLSHRTLRADGRVATSYDLWNEALGRADGNDRPLNQPIPKVTPGRYRLRFYFAGSQPGMFDVVSGPQFEVAP